MENQIRFTETPRDYFTQYPNVVDIMRLSPHAKALYITLRRVAGERGSCWMSTRTLADTCGMSTGKVSEAKQELVSVVPPLIHIQDKKFEKGTYHDITITDIWEVNHAYWTGEDVYIVCADGTVLTSVNQEQEQEQPQPPQQPQPDLDPVFGEAWTFYQNNINPVPTPYEAETFQDLCRVHTATWVMNAAKIAVQRNARNLRYMSVILERWKSDGYGSEPRQPKRTTGKPAAQPGKSPLQRYAEGLDGN